MSGSAGVPPSRGWKCLTAKDICVGRITWSMFQEPNWKCIFTRCNCRSLEGANFSSCTSASEREQMYKLKYTSDLTEIYLGMGKVSKGSRFFVAIFANSPGLAGLCFSFCNESSRISFFTFFSIKDSLTFQWLVSLQRIHITQNEQSSEKRDIWGPHKFPQEPSKTELQFSVCWE